MGKQENESIDPQFAGMCLQNGTTGSNYIHHYDEFSPAVRDRIRRSPFNICPACIQLQVNGRKFVVGGIIKVPPKNPFQAIEEFEQEIRRQDAHGI